MLSATTCCVQEATKTPETSPREGRDRAIHIVAGRLANKAWKIHNILGNYVSDNSSHVVGQQWDWGSGTDGPDTFHRPEPNLTDVQPLTYLPWCQSCPSSHTLLQQTPTCPPASSKSTSHHPSSQAAPVSRPGFPIWQAPSRKSCPCLTKQLI